MKNLSSNFPPTKIFPARRDNKHLIADKGGAGRGRKLIGRKLVNLIVGWFGQFLFFVVRRHSPMNKIHEAPQGYILARTLLVHITSSSNTNSIKKQHSCPKPIVQW